MAPLSAKAEGRTDTLKTKHGSGPARGNRFAGSGFGADDGKESSGVAARPVFQRLDKAKIQQDDLILFTNQLSVMLESGVVLSDALGAIVEQIEQSNPVFSAIISQCAAGVKNGGNFSKVLAEYPKVFNVMFISMVRASEASGRMSEMLGVLSSYLEFELDTRKRIKSALTYPFIMAIMAVAATGTLMFFVLPRFMTIYESRGASLPKLTQILVDLSGLLANLKVSASIFTTAVLAGIFFRYWSRTPMGRRVIDYIKIHTPVVGTMFIDTVVTRSMRIMATMVNTGVSLLDSIEVIQGACENYYFQQLWGLVDKKIRNGYQLSESIQIAQGLELFLPDKADEAGAGPQLIAPGIIQMLRAGEKSGKLGEVSDKISAFYEKKLESSIRNVMTLIEPLMVTIMGSIIGTIAIALLLPVFKISTVVSR